MIEARLEDAYRTCREIARREAKNFYYAFVALPRPKRNAICAVYAFMRHADDLADDETVGIDQRKMKLGAWRDAWRSAAAAGSSGDPIFLALIDAQRRFGIPNQLLEQLVDGTTMDLNRASEADGSSPGLAYDTYATFADLYGYCYLVASVVGLVCIRIFGYQDVRAEHLAEETGVAFQLTNILRDVREDAERRRIYLPCEDIKRHGVSIEDLKANSSNGSLSVAARSLLKYEAERAERYYESAKKLLPLIEADSRPALWVLVTIYHRLLRRIERAGFDVFSSRIRVPAYEKLAILAIGIAGVLRSRLLFRH